MGGAFVIIERVVGRGTKRELIYLLSVANQLCLSSAHELQKSIRIVHGSRLHLVACVEIATINELPGRRKLLRPDDGKVLQKTNCLRRKNETHSVENASIMDDISVVKVMPKSDVKKIVRGGLIVIINQVLLLYAVLPAYAKIGTEFQMQLGNPSCAIADTNNHDHFLIQRTVETLDYSDNLREPNWVSFREPHQWKQSGSFVVFRCRWIYIATKHQPQLDELDILRWNDQQ